MDALFEWIRTAISMEITTRTVISVDLLLQRAGRCWDQVWVRKLTVLKGFQYRLELNFSKHSRFHIPARFESEYACALTWLHDRAIDFARTTIGSLIHLRKHKITPKWAYQRLLQSQNRPRKFLKIDTDVLYDMVVDYRVLLCPISNTAN